MQQIEGVNDDIQAENGLSEASLAPMKLNNRPFNVFDGANCISAIILGWRCTKTSRWSFAKGQ